MTNKSVPLRESAEALRRLCRSTERLLKEVKRSAVSVTNRSGQKKASSPPSSRKGK